MPAQPRVLVVDDEQAARDVMARRIADETKAAVAVAESGPAALRMIDEFEPDIAVVDHRMPGMTGFELLKLVRERALDIDILIVTAFPSLSLVADVMQHDASDVLYKPFLPGELSAKLSSMLLDRQLLRQSEAGASQSGATERRGLVGKDPAFLAAAKLIGRYARSDSIVLIRGESGTGKELVAREIHDRSDRAEHPFVAINCASLASGVLESELFGHVRGAFTGAIADRPGYFASAGAGTVFLDEVGDTSPEFQAKLLRVLQEREFMRVGSNKPIALRARIIAATHRDLERMLREGRFREDLHYRLRVAEIQLPPLRRRPSDVIPLAEHFISKAAMEAGRPAPPLTPDAKDALQQHDWPGNVRELETCMRAAFDLATTGVIRARHLGVLSQEANGTFDEPEPLDQVIAAHILRTLRYTDWNITRTAKILGISRNQLYRRMEAYGIAAPEGAR